MAKDKDVVVFGRVLTILGNPIDNVVVIDKELKLCVYSKDDIKMFGKPSQSILEDICYMRISLLKDESHAIKTLKLFNIDEVLNYEPRTVKIKREFLENLIKNFNRD